MRVMARPGMSGYHGLTGEYGWDGWLGPYFSNAPEQGLTFLLGMQKQNAGTNRLTRSLRNAVNIYLQNLSLIHILLHRERSFLCNKVRLPHFPRQPYLYSFSFCKIQSKSVMAFTGVR